LLHESRIEALEHDLAAPEEPQLTVGLAVEPVQVDVPIAALPIDLRTAEVQLPVPPHDSDWDPPLHALCIPWDNADRIAEATDSDLDVLIGAVLRGRVAASARTVYGPDLDDHNPSSLLGHQSGCGGTCARPFSLRFSPGLPTCHNRSPASVIGSEVFSVKQQIAPYINFQGRAREAM